MEHGENHIMIIDEDGNEELCEILQYMEYDERVKVYLNFLQAVFLNCDISNLKQVFNNIEKVFPDLNKDMKKVMKGYRGNNTKLFFKIKFFLLSPRSYLYFFKFKNTNFGGI